LLISLFIGKPVQFLPQPGIAFHARKEISVGHRLNVEAGSSHEDRQATSALDILDRLPGQALILLDRKGMVRIDDIDQVVGNPFPFLRRHLGRPDIHVAVYLHRVPGDDLAPEGGGQGEAERRFSDGGGSDNHQKRPPHPSFPSTRITPNAYVEASLATLNPKRANSPLPRRSLRSTARRATRTASFTDAGSRGSGLAKGRRACIAEDSRTVSPNIGSNITMSKELSGSRGR